MATEDIQLGRKQRLAVVATMKETQSRQVAVHQKIIGVHRARGRINLRGGPSCEKR